MLSESLSWKLLDELSSNLAANLGKFLISESPIIVYGHKNLLMPICFLAAVKSGRAYVPVDISVPLSRLEDIIRSVKPDIILAAEKLNISCECKIYDYDSIKALSTKQPEYITREKWLKPEEIFYIIFTSGSTGKPKGVKISRSCLDNFIKWAVTLCGNNSFRFLNQAPFSFDLSVMDLYLCLYLGGTEIAIDHEILSDMKSLIKLFTLSEASIWVSTPSFAEFCLSERKYFTSETLPKLQRFLFCGETLSNMTAKKLQNSFPEAKIYNTYGPTESTVAVTEILIDSAIQENYNPLPIGKAKKGTYIFIEDTDGKQLKDGEKGEIIIAGDTVSPGYWNDDEKTQKSFSQRIINGQIYRAYKTGDKGYFQDGNLYYCGRIDLQIKLHGFRIELEDIENNLAKLDEIIKAVVIPCYRNDGQIRSLSAFVKTREHVNNNFETEQNIRSKLRGFIPEYMIPKKFYFIDDFPMTDNGKINRMALQKELL